MLTIHVHLPISAPIATLSSITVSEVGGGGHNAQPLVFSGPFTSGACPPGCPGSPSNPCFSLICGATSFHNGPHTISVAGSCWTFPGPPPMFMTQRPIQGQITVDIGNLVVAATQPVNPEPILWHAEPGETVQLSATASAAYKALQPVKLTIYTSDQSLVKTFEWSAAVGPGVSELGPVTWDGSQDPPLEGTAPAGVYLFRWEVGGPGPTMDSDQDKSGTQITGTTLDYDYARDQWLSDATVEGRSALSQIRVFAPSLAVVASAVGTPTPQGWHAEMKDFILPEGGEEVFLVDVRDTGDMDGSDRAHRARYALQRNQRVLPYPVALLGFSCYPPPADTDDIMRAAWSILRTTRPFRVGQQLRRLKPPHSFADAVFVDKNATFAQSRLGDSWLYVTATHGRGGMNKGYALLFDGNTWLCGAPTPPAQLPGQQVYISQAGAVPNTVILTGCQSGQNHQDSRSLMGACRTKGVAGRGGQTGFITFTYLRAWHEAFASSIRSQARNGAPPYAYQAAREATMHLGSIVSLGGGAPSPFIFNEQEIPW